ncbi:hypothetical protein AB4099_18825 [Bosea sp. 2KB_26]|uniref:hypothetical protein n=1 Tax=Bosea sp. 2KB_26 TaxID=3237475 RepID=UPI003F93F635
MNGEAAPGIAPSWLLAVLFAAIVGLTAYAFLRAIYDAPIDWEQDASNDQRRPIEDIARDAGL